MKFFSAGAAAPLRGLLRALEGSDQAGVPLQQACAGPAALPARGRARGSGWAGCGSGLRGSSSRHQALPSGKVRRVSQEKGHPRCGETLPPGFICCSSASGRWPMAAWGGGKPWFCLPRPRSRRRSARQGPSKRLIPCLSPFFLRRGMQCGSSFLLQAEGGGGMIEVARAVFGAPKPLPGQDVHGVGTWRDWEARRVSWLLYK